MTDNYTLILFVITIATVHKSLHDSGTNSSRGGDALFLHSVADSRFVGNFAFIWLIFTDIELNDWDNYILWTPIHLTRAPLFFGDGRGGHICFNVFDDIQMNYDLRLIKGVWDYMIVLSYFFQTAKAICHTFHPYCRSVTRVL